MQPDKKAHVREFIDSVLNNGNIESAHEYYHEDVTEEEPFRGQEQGITGLKSMCAEFRNAFPDLHWEVEEQILEGDRVLTRFTWTGTHKGEFMGIPATDVELSVRGMVIDRFQDSKIQSTHLLMDNYGMMQQLGLIPE